MLKKVLIVLLLPCLGIQAQDRKYPFVLPDLPYEYNALEPYIDAETMKIHHNAHHKAYVDNLNAALKDNAKLQSKTLDWLLKNLDKIKDTKTRIAVRNNGGGHWNHSFFWKIMGNTKNTGPKKLVLTAIKDAFCSFDKFKEQFNTQAKKVFGSGWAWLSVDPDGKLVISSTANQDSPITQELKPILGLDVWEHAYYLKYQNKRPDYLQAWWNVINWDQVEENYKQAKK